MSTAVLEIAYMFQHMAIYQCTQGTLGTTFLNLNSRLKVTK